MKSFLPKWITHDVIWFFLDVSALALWAAAFAVEWRASSLAFMGIVLDRIVKEGK